MSNERKTQKVGLGEKVCFFMANAGNIPLMTLLSMFLTIFYTNVCGLNPTGVATMFLLSKVVDGISDPIMGFLMDRMPQTKFGRMRTALIFGSLICSINYVFVWFGPYWVPAAGMAVAYISYLLLGITFDIMDVSLNSMLPLMTDDLKTRNQLAILKMIATTGTAIVISIVGPTIVADMKVESFYVLIGGCLVIVLVGSIGGALGIHERIKLSEGTEEKYSVKELFKIIGYRPVLVMLVVNLISTTASMLITGVGAYYYTYILGNLALMSIVSLCVTFAQLPAMFVSAWLSNRIGKKKTFLLGLVVSVVGLAMRIPFAASLALVVVSTVVYSLGSGLTSALIFSIQADNSNVVEYRIGKHAEGAIASTTSFIVKFAQGIGGAIPLYILGAFGFDPNSAVQSASATNGILMSFSVIPCIAYVISAVIFGIMYNITKEDMDEINQKLIEKHENL